MDNFKPNWTKKFMAVAGRISAYTATLAVGGAAVYLFFRYDEPEKWGVAGLVGAYCLISVLWSEILEKGFPQFSWLYLVFQASIVSTLLFYVPNMTFFVIWFYILSIEAMMSFSKQVGLMWVFLFAVLSVITLSIGNPTDEVLIYVPIYLGGFFFFASFGLATRNALEARRESERLLAELKNAHQQLQAYAQRAEEFAVSEERNRLAREMHDTVGHRLTVSAVQLEGAKKLIAKDPTRAEVMVDTVREQIREGLNELRSSVAALRQPLETDLSLDKSIRRLAQTFETGTGLTVNLILPAELPPLSALHRLALYRTAQEALTNVQKHAKAEQVWMQLNCVNDIITLRVSDNGMGMSGQASDASFGLRGIQERMTQLGGRMQIENRPGGGTQLLVSLPIAA